MTQTSLSPVTLATFLVALATLIGIFSRAAKSILLQRALKPMVMWVLETFPDDFANVLFKMLKADEHAKRLEQFINERYATQMERNENTARQVDQILEQQDELFHMVDGLVTTVSENSTKLAEHVTKSDGHMEMTAAALKASTHALEAISNNVNDNFKYFAEKVSDISGDIGKVAGIAEATNKMVERALERMEGGQRSGIDARQMNLGIEARQHPPHVDGQ